MKKHIVVLTALLLGGCIELGQSSKSITGNSYDSTENDTTTTTGDNTDFDILFLETTDPENATEESNTENPETTEINACTENEYWEKTVGACVSFPCCDISGNWTFVFNDMTTFPWKPITYSATIQQAKAALKFELTSAGTPKDLVLPKFMTGTLEKSVLHMDGNGAGGFLTLDATDVKKQLADDEISGSYTWLVTGGTTMNGTFYLQR